MRYAKLCKAVLTACSNTDRVLALSVRSRGELKILLIYRISIDYGDDSVYTISLQSNLSDIIENVKN